MTECEPKATDVSRKTLVFSVLISIFLTSIIVGSIVFAWQNAEVTDDLIFRQELLKAETQSLEQQLDIVGKEVPAAQ